MGNANLRELIKVLKKIPIGQWECNDSSDETIFMTESGGFRFIVTFPSSILSEESSFAEDSTHLDVYSKTCSSTMLLSTFGRAVYDLYRSLQKRLDGLMEGETKRLWMRVESGRF